jgi:hypothetical protein
MPTRITREMAPSRSWSTSTRCSAVGSSGRNDDMSATNRVWAICHPAMASATIQIASAVRARVLTARSA